MRSTNANQEKITQNTRALAKRQITFNKSQFNDYTNKPIFGSPDELRKSINKYMR